MENEILIKMPVVLMAPKSILLTWVIEEGSKVDLDTPLFEVKTSRGGFDFLRPESFTDNTVWLSASILHGSCCKGIVERVFRKKGEAVKIGDVIMRIQG